jgi:diaminopimelate epimerase
MKDVSFVKYDAAGNDFIVVSAVDLQLPAGFGPKGRKAGNRLLAALARAILARHTGVGADGLLVSWPPMNPRNHAALQVFNADGSEAEMSGNGVRCLAAWLLEAGMGLARVAIETPAGLRTAEHTGGGYGGERLFRVQMGEPVFEPQRIPFRDAKATAPIVRYPLRTSLGAQEVTVLSMGNPHCTVFVKSFDDLDWRALGREIESHSLFPNRTNVEFVRMASPTEIEVRFWERGVGETASSGTGSSAAVVASSLNGHSRRSVRVETLGGPLRVEWGPSGLVFLTGPVRRIASGTYEHNPRKRKKTS